MLRRIRRHFAGLMAATSAAVALCTAWFGVDPSLGGETSRDSTEEAVVEKTAGVALGVLPGRLTGVNSCAAASCHGGGRVGEDLSFAASQVWQRRDPHAGAWQVLTQPLAQEMMRRLASPGEEPIPAIEDTRCLNCHITTETPLTEPRIESTSYHRDGVGCESCHGAASGWLSLHTTLDWKGYTAEQKAATGFVDTTANLGRRADLCVGCHVGGVGRDVNHDLIAAGHPRLDFEFRMFHANEPKHWSSGGVGGRNLDVNIECRETFEAEAWVEGQAAAGRAALRLLRERTAAGKPWPELAEYSCFSCHHDLRSDSWYRLSRGSTGRLQWGTWTFGAFRGVESLAGSDAALSELRQLMERRGSDRTAVRDLAERLEGMLAERESGFAGVPDEGALDRMAVSLIDGSAAAVRLRGHSGENAVSPAAGTWDEAAQLYLGLHAIFASRSRLGAGLSTEEQQLLEEMRRGLLFEVRVNSPGNRGTLDAVREMSQRVQGVRDELERRGR